MAPQGSQAKITLSFYCPPRYTPFTTETWRFLPKQLAGPLWSGFFVFGVNLPNRLMLTYASPINHRCRG